MAIEHEIKLALPCDQVATAMAALTELAGMSPQQIMLENVYYDTPERALRAAQCSVRLRNASGRWLQTLKSGGKASNGLHSRNEWEMLVERDALDLDALIDACEDHRLQDLLRAVGSALKPVFRTDFTREIWSIQSGGAHIEAALDTGEVKAMQDAANRRTAICEIELELKHGDETDLRALATRLRERLPGLAPDDVSKAQRGYALLSE